MNIRKTKIIATIGPASSDPKILQALIQAGLNVARLNFAHGNYEEKKSQIQNVRRISQKLKIPVEIMADLQGPKLRLGLLPKVRQIQKGDIIALSHQASEKNILTQFDLTPHVFQGERIFINDGLVEFLVLTVNETEVLIKAQNDGVISSKKGINIPDSLFKGSAFTKKDQEDLEFVLKEGVDFIALSFVQTADDLKIAKVIIDQYKSGAKIIAKIEKKLALDNLEDILKFTDVVMVARGDLGVEMKAAHVPLIQQKIINLAKQFQKPVIVATHMLESMINNPRPTRAEVSDVANAVFDRADAVMLSAETATGKYPVEAVAMMNEIIVAIEEHQNLNLRSERKGLG